jgi:UDP-N-acetylglucosamine:LPS N-acetylglucosamine transferase
MSNPQTSSRKITKVLAVASGGGHWVQLLRLRPALVGLEVVYAGGHLADSGEVQGHRFYRICDATRWTKLRLILSAFQLVCIICWERPDVVISTGAAPGYIAIRIAKLVRAKTIWLDSIANVERLSLSGALVGPHADLWLTQWPHLERENGPSFKGAVL